MANKRFYVVWKGRQPGVYDNLDDAMEQVDNFPGALFKSFASAQEAADAFRKSQIREDRTDLGNLILNSSRKNIPESGKPDYFSFPEIDLNGWAVDASCLGNPGRMEYRGVELMTGRELFRVGPFEKSTNNIGEFLAIVHALALMYQTGENHTIYSDSVTGMAWVRNRKIKTQLTREPVNEKSFQMMERALTWLHTHQYSARILKWQTEIWGEIPADFGRK
ncbi:MAG: ribonuclease H family protein [Muribaculaceae bacterium]|nr:ribonuclease H [Bacteroides sp.]MBD5340992.1 ribonuclease H [Bacteroides sp.]MDE6071484.1 ribonuclease H family protein [Muribaculaceae bacterium]